MEKVAYPIPREKIVCPRCGAREAILWTDRIIDCKACGIYDERDPTEVRFTEEVRRVG